MPINIDGLRRACARLESLQESIHPSMTLLPEHFVRDYNAILVFVDSLGIAAAEFRIDPADVHPDRYQVSYDPPRYELSTDRFIEHSIFVRKAGALRRYLETVSAVNEESREPEYADPVMQIPNRTAFDAALPALVQEAIRYGRPLSLAFGDVDHFKKVNDTLGHVAGDAVLREVAARVKFVTEGRGTVYRYGGEEICLILPNHSVDEALAVAERARRQIEAKAINGIVVTASFGVATLPDHATNVEGLVAAADKAVYNAKDRGRNLVRYFGETEAPRPGPRETDRKAPQPGRLRDAQRAELRRLHLRGENVYCPKDNALLRVVDISTTDSFVASGGALEFAIVCPGCGLRDQLQ